MQNLVAFLIRFRVFLGFLGLQLLCFVLYFQFVTYPTTVFMTTASDINGALLERKKNLYAYFHLLETNRTLQIENAQLRGVALDNYYRLQRPEFYKNDTLYQQYFNYIPAEIIRASSDQRNNYFTLNAGKAQGLKKGMGVISPNGAVGVVYKVGGRYSLVKSILTSDINLDVIIGKKEIRGLLKWNGINAKIGSITGVSRDVDVPRWSEVRTQGATGIFPKGLLIGKVLTKRSMEDQSLWDIDVLFKEDLKNIHTVYVIRSLIADELETLQKDIPLVTQNRP